MHFFSEFRNETLLPFPRERDDDDLQLGNMKRYVPPMCDSYSRS